MIRVGIDIGKSGGIAWMDDDGSHVCVGTMPMIGNELDVLELHSIMRNLAMPGTHVVFEKLGVIFGSSKATARSMGLQEGVIEALCVAHGIAYTKVPAKTWQKEMFEGVPEQTRSDGKRDTKAMALVATKRLFPRQNLLATPKSKVPHDGIVDALLMAEYCRRHFK